MEHPGFEVETIYVDLRVNRCQYDGGRGARREGDRLAFGAPRPRPKGRNAGWRVARGAIVLFLDGRHHSSPALLLPTRLRPSRIRPSRRRLGGIAARPLETASLYNRVLDLDWIYPPGFTAFCGGDALFRRATLEAAGGYDETLIAGEEPELCRRITALGQRIPARRPADDRPRSRHHSLERLLATRHARGTRVCRGLGALREDGSSVLACRIPTQRNPSYRLARTAGCGIASEPRVAQLLAVRLRDLLPRCARCANGMERRAGSPATVWRLRFTAFIRICSRFPIFVGQVRCLEGTSGADARAALVEYKQP